MAQSNRPFSSLRTLTSEHREVLLHVCASASGTFCGRTLAPFNVQAFGLGRASFCNSLYFLPAGGAAHAPSAPAATCAVKRNINSKSVSLVSQTVNHNIGSLHGAGNKTEHWKKLLVGIASGLVQLPRLACKAILDVL